MATNYVTIKFEGRDIEGNECSREYVFEAVPDSRGRRFYFACRTRSGPLEIETVSEFSSLTAAAAAAESHWNIYLAKTHDERAD